MIKKIIGWAIIIAMYGFMIYASSWQEFLISILAGVVLTGIIRFVIWLVLDL